MKVQRNTRQTPRRASAHQPAAVQAAMLDLYDIGSEVPEHLSGVGGHDNGRELDDPHARERTLQFFIRHCVRSYEVSEGTFFAPLSAQARRSTAMPDSSMRWALVTTTSMCGVRVGFHEKVIACNAPSIMF